MPDVVKESRLPAMHNHWWDVVGVGTDTQSPSMGGGWRIALGCEGHWAPVLSDGQHTHSVREECADGDGDDEMGGRRRHQ